MGKIKLDDRIENAVNAFFEAEPDRWNFPLIYTGYEARMVADESTFFEKAEKWTGVLRELFMFGPGTFCLFYMTLMVIYFYPTIGISFQGLFMTVSAAFLTYAGSGSIKEKKNLAVPGTVIAMAAAVAFVSSLFPASDIYFWYSIYLFPIVLVAAKLVQGWVSGEK